MVNSTNIFDYNEMFFSQTYNKDEFELMKINYNISLFCFVCVNESFALNLDGKCEKCSQKIKNCEKCSYSNSIIRNYSRFIQENFEQNYISIQGFSIYSFTLKCSKCTSKTFPIKPNFDICMPCSQECDGCLYISTNEALDDEKLWEDTSSSLICDFYLKCEAENYFNFKYKFCMKCPENCLNCIMNENGSVLCQICKSEFLLSFQTNLCQKIVDSLIPCINGLLIDENHFICQSIWKKNFYNIQAHFSSSSIIINATKPFYFICQTCETKFCYEEYLGRNMSNLLYEDIRSLVELNSIWKKEDILEKCTKCLYDLEAYPYCDCNDVIKDLALFNDYHKILENEHLFHQIYPDLIYYESFKIIFENMRYPYHISTDQGCLICPLSFSYCILDRFFQGENTKKDDQKFATTYQDKGDCSYGFQPNVTKKTCEFCPKEYGQCTQIKKQFRIYFDDSDNEKFTFSDLKQLQEWTTALINNQEISYVMKSFQVAVLEILVIFRNPLNFLIYPGEMQSILINLSKPLSLCFECSLFIVFKGEPWNNTYIPSIILGSSIRILENHVFRIENLIFEIPYFLNDHEPKAFIYIHSDEFFLENCSFVTNKDFYINTEGELIALKENERNSEFFNENYKQIFEMQLENTNAFLKNIEIEIKSDNSNSESIFNLILNSSVYITNFLIKNTHLQNLNLMYLWIRSFESSKIYLMNITIINSSFIESSIFLGDSKGDFGEIKLNINQMVISNLFLLSTKVFNVYHLANQPNVVFYIDSSLIRTSYFENSVILSSGERILYINEFALVSNVFNQSIIIDDLTENLLQNLFFLRNSFLIKFIDKKFKYFTYFSFFPTIISEVQEDYSMDDRFLIYFESNEFIMLDGRAFFFMELFNAVYAKAKKSSFENFDFVFVNQSDVNLFNISQSKVPVLFKSCKFIDIERKNAGIYFYNKEIFQKNFVLSDCLFLGVAFGRQKIVFEMDVQNNREIKFINLKFLKCKIIKRTNLDGEYGLISFDNSQLSLFNVTVSFENCEFDYFTIINSLEKSTDLISFILLNSIRGKLLITNSTFKATLENYQINENHIFLSIKVSFLEIIDCFFEFDNIQPNFSPSISLFIKAKIVALTINSTFFQNLKSSTNGALYIILSEFGDSKISNCSFLNLTAENGAAISINSVNTQCVFYIENSIFSLILSSGQGGVFHILSIILFIINCKFVDFFSQEGGLLFTIQSKILMLYCIVRMTKFLNTDQFHAFYLNFLESYSGPAFSLSYQSKLTLEECEVADIWPPSYGYSLVQLGIAELVSLNTIFRDNLFAGGGVSSFNSKIDLKGIKFIDNKMIDCGDINFDYVCREKKNIFYESIILINSESTLRMQESVLFNNHLEKVNFLKSDLSSVIFQSNKFIENKALMGTILTSYRIKNSSLFHIIDSCLFIFNEASNDGGALFFLESNFSIRNSSFINCSSIQGRGGAISIQCPLNWMPNMNELVFINNSALIGGAIYYNLYTLFLWGSNLFRGNRAGLFGNTFFSYPKRLKLVDNRSFYQINDEFITNNLRSGDKLSNFLLRMLCEDEETIEPNLFFNYQLEIINPDHSVKKFSMNEVGYFNLTEFYITHKPNSTLILNMSCEFILDPLLLSPKIFKIIINFRPCQIGELYRKTPLQICEPCSPDKYSYNISDEFCKLCPNNGANCSKKLNGIFFINNGFWRDKLESDLIIKCFRLEDNCIEGFEAGDRLCFEGHVGARCESCDGRNSFWNETFAKNNKYSCVKCSEAKYGFLYFFLSFGLFCAFLGVSLKGLIRFIELEMNLKQNLKKKQTGKNEELGFYMKILLFYLQIIASISEFDLPLSNYLHQTLSGFGSPLSFSLYSLDCLLSYNFGQLKIPIVFLRIIVILLIPLLYLIITYLFYMVWMINSRFKYKESMKKSLIIFNFIYFQKSLTSEIVRVIACEKIADDFYIKADVSFKCNTFDHLNYSSFLFIPSLLFIILIFPLIVGWRIYLKRKILHELETRTEYGYLYNEYKVYYWEFLKMYMKVFISIFLEFYDSDIHTKGLLILLLIFGYLIILQKKNPYFNEILNKLEAVSSIVCFLSILICLLVYKNEYLFMVIISIIFLIFINAAFTAFLAKKICSNFIVKIIENLKLMRKNQKKLIDSQFSSKKIDRIKKKHIYDMSEIYEKHFSNIELEFVSENFRYLKKNSNILNTT